MPCIRVAYQYGNDEAESADGGLRSTLGGRGSGIRALLRRQVAFARSIGSVSRSGGAAVDGALRVERPADETSLAIHV